MDLRRTQFTFYDSFFQALSRIRDASARCLAYDVLCRYALFGEEPDLNGLPETVAIAFEMMKPNLAAGRRKAAGGSASKTREAGGTAFEAASGRGSGESLVGGMASGMGFAGGEQCGAFGSCEAGVIGRNRQGNKDGRYPQDAGRYPQDAGRYGEVLPNKDKNKNKEKNKDKYKDKRQIQAEFDRFWEAYPRKEGRYRAYQAYSRVCGDIELLIASLEKQKRSEQWRKEGGRFIPHADRWLNEKRWEDILAPASDIPKGASGVLGEAELEAIRQVLNMPQNEIWEP